MQFGAAFPEKVVNIASLELGLVSNESSGNFTFNRGTHEFFKPTIFENITVVLILCCFSFPFTQNFREMATTS